MSVISPYHGNPKISTSMSTTHAGGTARDVERPTVLAPRAAYAIAASATMAPVIDSDADTEALTGCLAWWQRAIDRRPGQVDFPEFAGDLIHGVFDAIVRCRFSP